MDDINDNASVQSSDSRVGILARIAVIAALYGVGTLLIAPIAYGPIQVRITDVLLPISYNKKIGLAGVWGVTLGNLVANIVSPYGFPDLVVGTIANAVASMVAYKVRFLEFRQGIFFATILPSGIIAFFIGVVLLSWTYGLDAQVSFLTILIGELISCVGLGIPLLVGLDKSYR